MDLGKVSKRVRIIMRWQKVASARRGRRTSKSKSGVPADVPEGHLAIYAGFGYEIRRFIVPATYFNHPLFRALLDKVEEEFGFARSGPIFIPYNPNLFHRILCLLSESADNITDSNIRRLVEHISEKEMESKWALASGIRVPSFYFHHKQPGIRHRLMTWCC